jgi:hypothetical protein
MTGYNGVPKVKVNHAEIGICPKHGYWLTAEKCNCEPEWTAVYFVAELKRNEEEMADKLRVLVDEALKLEIPVKATCQNCAEGMVELPDNTLGRCACCHGDYLNCPTCQTDEGKTTTQIAIESAKYNVEHATPENKAWAEKRLQEELGKASRL